MGSWLHDSHDTALLGSAMLDPSQPYIYPPISIYLHQCRLPAGTEQEYISETTRLSCSDLCL